MIVIKIIISVFIVILTAYIGAYKAMKLKQRERILREMVTFLKLVGNEIKYMMNILPNAYEIARQKLNTELKVKIGQIVVDMLDSNNITYIEGSIEKSRFIKEGRLNMRLVLERFVACWEELYRQEDEPFIEKNGRKFFLLFLILMERAIII